MSPQTDLSTPPISVPPNSANVLGALVVYLFELEVDRRRKNAGDEERPVPTGLMLLATAAFARDDGRYANSRLKQWFESLRSQFGQCCTNADGYIVSDPDWESDRGHYRVRLEWVLVPDGAVITQPNRARSSPPLSGASVLSASRWVPLVPFPLASPARFSRSLQESG